MTGNTIAVTLGILLLGLLLTSLWVRLPRITLLDCFLLSIALFFGAYTVIDAMAVDSQQTDGLAVATVFFLIAASAMVFWFFARKPSPLLKRTSLLRLQLDWQACPAWPIIGLISLAVLYRWYTAAYFSEYGPLDATALEALDQNLPYWYTSLGMVVTVGLYPAALCSWGKVRASTGLRRFFWAAMLAASAMMIMGLGRRSMLAFLVIIGWDLLTNTRIQRHRWMAFALLVLSVPLFITISNLYQAYRGSSVRGVPLENITSDVTPESFLEGATDLNRTMANLQEREAIWRHNYEVVKAHLDGRGDLQWGRLFVASIPNLVPAALYPGKTIFDTQGELIEAFNLENTDKSENIFANTYADFGMLSAIAAPLMILLIVWVCAVAMRHFRDPFLRVLLMGTAIFYAMNLESSYVVPLGFARDFVVIALAYLAIRTVVRLGWHELRTIGQLQA